MTVIPVLALLIVIVAVVVRYESALRTSRRNHDEAMEALRETVLREQGALQRARESDAAATEVVFAVMPLVEKTDWTTGNYIGRLDYLREQESTRNKHVNSLRKTLWEIPVVKDNIPADVTGLLAAIGTSNLAQLSQGDTT